eukprot:1961696-Amphidinium_carterae.1
MSWLVQRLPPRIETSCHQPVVGKNEHQLKGSHSRSQLQLCADHGRIFIFYHQSGVASWIQSLAKQGRSLMLRTSMLAVVQKVCSALCRGSAGQPARNGQTRLSQKVATRVPPFISCCWHSNDCTAL